MQAQFSHLRRFFENGDLFRAVQRRDPIDEIAGRLEFRLRKYLQQAIVRGIADFAFGLPRGVH